MTVGHQDSTIVYQGCEQPGFQPVPGTIVGKTRLEDICEIPNRHVDHELGFAFTVEIGNGWRAAWLERPNEKSQVNWVFRRTPVVVLIDDLRLLPEINAGHQKEAGNE